MCDSIVGCLSCDTVAGRFHPPGGIVYNGSHWIVALRKDPVRQPCLPYIILKRHCEDVAELNAEEAATLGPFCDDSAECCKRAWQPRKSILASTANK